MMDGELIVMDALDMIDVGLGVFDRENRLIFANAAFRTLRGYPEDLCRAGVSLADLLSHNAVRGDFGEGVPGELVRMRLDEIAATGDRVAEHVRPDGQVLKINYLRRDDGGLVITYRDRTPEQRAEKALRRSEERYALVSEAADEAIYDWDIGAGHFFATPRLDELLGHDIAGSAQPMEAWQQLVHPEDLDRVIAATRAHFKGETEALEREYRVRARGGGYRWVHDRGVAVRDENGRVARLVGAVRDVTGAHAAEEQLAATQTRLVSSLSSLSDGILMVDAQRRVELFNQRYVEIFSSAAGQDASPIIEIGRYFFDMIRDGYNMGMFQPNPGGVDAWIENRLKAWDKPVSQWELELANGSWILLNEREMPDGGRISIYTDITELKNRESDAARARDEAEATLADLRKTQERLVQSEKMASLGQLTAGIAHEIKNPLNFVNNFSRLSAEMLEELEEILQAPIRALNEDDRDDAEDLFETVRENLGKIAQHGQRADSIVKNMLLHSREGPSERQTVGLNAMAEEALNLAYHGARAEDKSFNIEVIRDLDAGLGEVDCYPQDLMRVFLNLMTNGMYAAARHRAMSAEAVGPQIALKTRLRGDMAEITVRDNGTGIPEEVLEKIFLPFFTTKPAGEGTGLGLSLSYDIVVKQHGGSLTVDSVPGQYTAFTVTVPRLGPAGGGPTGEDTYPDGG